MKSARYTNVLPDTLAAGLADWGRTAQSQAAALGVVANGVRLAHAAAPANVALLLNAVLDTFQLQSDESRAYRGDAGVTLTDSLAEEVIVVMSPGCASTATVLTHDSEFTRDVVTIAETDLMVVFREDLADAVFRITAAEDALISVTACQRAQPR